MGVFLAYGFFPISVNIIEREFYRRPIIRGPDTSNGDARLREEEFVTLYCFVRHIFK